MEQIAISVNSIKKQFNDKQIIAPLSLNVPEGQIIGLLGPSGCGKTTFIKMLMGMLKPDQGTIRIFNYLVPHKKLLKEIGYMAQTDALYLDLTGEENLYFFAKLFSLTKEQREERVRYVSKLVHLTNDLPKKVIYYSGGMKRRLSLAMALIHNPKLLILDEPTVGIDPVLKNDIWQELDKLKKEQKTIVLTTHAMDEAERCDYLIMLREGKIIAQGTPKEIKNYYNVDNFDEAFIKAGGAGI